MNPSLKPTLCGLAGAMALLAAGAAFSASRPSEAQVRYQQERAACMRGTSNQDRATCLKEAVAAYQEARKGALAGSEGALAQNRTARCTALPQPERDECLQRMQAGTSTGTAREGAILRQGTTTVPAR